MAANGTTLVDTLQSIDALTGGAGTDTLNATLSGAGLVAPTLAGIDNVNLRVTTATGGVDLVAATGVTTVTVANSTAAANVQSTGAAALGVANQNTAVTFGGSTATALSLNLNTVGTAATDIAVNLGTTVANAATSFVITAKDAHVTFAEAVAGAATISASVAATGANEITFAGADLASLKSLTVTGAGSADFRGGALSALTTLTVADGGVKATITNATVGAVTVTTGAGADTITATGTGVKSISTGAGNDTVSLTGDAAATAAAVVAATKVTNLTALQAAIAVGTTDAAVAAATAAAVINLSILAGDKTAIDAASVSVAATVVDSVELAAVVAIISPLQTAANTALTAATAAAAAGTALAATSTVDLGAGNDSLNLAGTFVTGATIIGGDGTDTLGFAKAGYATVAAYVAADLAKVTGFEVLSIADTLVTADAAVDVSKITGIVSFKAAAGVATGNTASATNLGANSTVELAGADTNNGQLTVSLKTDTAADSLTLTLNHNFTDNNDTTSTTLAAATQVVVLADVESLTISSTGKNASLPFTAVDGYKADTITNTLALTGSNKLVAVNVTGDQALNFSSTSTMTKLATIDASANTGGLTFSGAAADVSTATSSAAMTIKGSATASNTLTGSGNSDTIVGGAKADVITGGAGGDTLTGNGGNDKFVFAAGDSTIAAGKADTITDFVANTLGNGLNGAVNNTGAITAGLNDATKLNGDVLIFSALSGATHGVTVGVYANASDASIFLQTQSATEAAIAGGLTANGTVHAALDSSTGNLYIDLDGNGTADSYIHLTGVTTLTAAAFVIVNPA